MILKSMNIKNFRSYYGDNTFEFAQGLTLIIGDNGDGKTTFFEALEWLFDTATENKSATNISEKRKSEMEVGDIDEVVVSLVFDHDGIIEIEKSFSFEKQTENSARTFDYKFIGYEDRGSERLSRNGKQLLEACFDTAIRKYCLFKGESQLDVFDNNTALKTLVDTFSNIRQFEDYVDLTEKFERDSDAVVIKALKQDKAQTKKVQQLESDKIRNLNDIQNVKDDIRTQEQAISDFTSSLEKLEENQDACEAYQEIKKRIEAKQNEIATYKARTSIDYNAQLLDDYWILRAFPSVLKEFQKKASAISREKRKLDRAETERRAIEKGKQEMANALANGATKLPWYVPNKETMQEMIDDEICKVCNRPAHKGTPEYEFMVNKLNEFLANSQAKSKSEEEEKPYFPNHYVEEIDKISNWLGGWNEKEIAEIAITVYDRLELIQAHKQRLEQAIKDLQEAEDEKARLLIQMQGISESFLEKGFKDYKGMSERKNRAEIRLADLNRQLADLEKERVRISYAFNEIEPSNNAIKRSQLIHQTLKLIMEAFAKAKDRNVNEFLTMLENETNKYFELLNENDFRGQIRIIKRADGSARIQLYSSNGTVISNPGGAQRTTMYMSVLFAISNITTRRREQDYPLIFDAPTSSFGGFKEDTFYNVIDTIDKQCVIVTKDLLNINKATGQKALDFDTINKLSCSVFRIEKVVPFNDKDLSTIRTIVKQVK
ncbi:AAA family ATPase [Tannerella forsythia]|uniref:AAA family ATPase n=1 Tax=Tannerella forsythia TaxID=28112 RepID=UPI000BE7162E|nr:AAA family ATPase [Tannerella forsythia]PDP70083.1 hypothetical protein CLI85_11005 [Tannerella forsythia]